ncbi:hypothetical protein CLAFUW4_20096 [Fulvia fulva]|uniref:uncharacterized protein n=1 Tax=Passalora fulva TaxID=5499 RepID=UPI0028524DFF|nr:uncharacterized protein CLAFUR5_20096 [Fulvia fulva]KAK4612009.1 hypothetical protein CLAFUR4_20096 [Fulvia fulva]KAK4612362.1 hypothetical protein CLAFUR0_20096 [Fulvia fulva]WMI39043.1 hypothetical protein CLAFUR5_20096 [Fulvia fulva]WPV21291.1 hypothetical protein CLAFUW4_20096 [Fulvia fulva]WPV35982.1 hypothetical protein CLAFUW7_20096 [Fulvia fulva]
MILRRHLPASAIAIPRSLSWTQSTMKILLAIVATVLMFAGCSREVEEAVAASDCCSFYKKEKTLPRDCYDGC